MIAKLERLFNIALVNIELMEQEINNGKVPGEAGRYAAPDSDQIQDNGIAAEGTEQGVLGIEGAGDRSTIPA